MSSTAYFDCLFEMSDYELLKKYLNRRGITNEEQDHIISDVSLRDDLTGEFISGPSGLSTCVLRKTFILAKNRSAEDEYDSSSKQN